MHTRPTSLHHTRPANCLFPLAGTTQVCLFRDAYKSITDAGLSVFGLSTDSPKANTTFKDKKELPYPLLCDSAATLIGALGFKKAPRGTIRGVVVVDKAGTVVVHQAAGPAATLEAAQAVLGKF
jgi:peroxiredoxin Q/BCP